MSGNEYMSMYEGMIMCYRGAAWAAEEKAQELEASWVKAKVSLICVKGIWKPHTLVQIKNEGIFITQLK